MLLSSQFPNVGRPDMDAVFAGQNYIPDNQPTWWRIDQKFQQLYNYILYALLIINFQSTKN